MRAKRAKSPKLGDSSKQELLTKLINSESQAEILDSLGIDTDTYSTYLVQLLEELAAKFAAQPVEHAFAEYWIDMQAILNGLRKQVKSATSREAIAGLRAMADIRTSLLKEARTLGIVKPIGGDSPDSNIFVQFVQGLSSEQLRAELFKLTQEFEAIDAEMVASPDFPSTNKAKSLFSGDSVFDQGLQGS